MSYPNLQSPKRRSFMKQAMGFSLSVLSISAMTERLNGALYASPVSEKKPAIPPDMVFEFVRVAHFDLNRVKEMLKDEPGLVNACWDWGGGDFETALGGASHLANRPVVEYLLQEGARKDIFCAAMLGDLQLVKAFVNSDPTIVNVGGPHTLTLLYHAAISGNVGIADIIKPHIKEIANHCNGALQAAAREGHLAMTTWLVSNGANDLNNVDFAGNTPLQNAQKKGNTAVAEFLKKQGGR